MGYRGRGILVGLGLLAFLGRGGASDWPDWRGPARDGHVPTGSKVPAQLAPDLRPVWHLKIGEGHASPVVAGGKVYYLDTQDHKETLHAVTTATGTELWRTVIDDVFTDFQSPAGPRCTPVVDADRIYALSAKGELRCLAVSDGHLLWRVGFGGEFKAEPPAERGQMQGAHRHGNTGTPLIVGDRLVAMVGDTNGAGVVCFDKRKGTVLWKSQNDRAGNAPPVIAPLPGTNTKQVLAFTAEGLIGLDLKSGALLWRVPLASTYGRHVTTPVVVGNLVLVASHERGMVGVAVERAPEPGKWTARILWDSKALTMNFSSPVAAGAYMYGLGPDRNVFCAEARTGKLMWSQTGYTPNPAENSHAALMVMGKNLLLLADTGELVLFPANPAGFKQLGRAQVCGVNWCNPAYADGRLYLRDHRELLCVKLLP